MIYNLYITYQDKESGLQLVIARQEVKRIAVNINEILVYYPNYRMETIILSNILRVELIEENFDNEYYEQERG